MLWPARQRLQNHHVQRSRHQVGFLCHASIHSSSMHRTSTAKEKFPKVFFFRQGVAARADLVLSPCVLTLKFATKDMSSRPERSEVEGSVFFRLASEQILKLTATRL